MKTVVKKKRGNPFPGYTPTTETEADFSPSIVEFTEVEESTRPAGVLARLKGRIAKTGIVNGNKRLYSKAVFEEAFKNAEERLKRGQILGEVKHPDYQDEHYDPLERAAIKFERLFFEDDPNDPDHPFAAYEAVLIDNEYGRHLKSLMDVGVHVGISTRGAVKMRTESQENRQVGIVEKFLLRAIDAVGNPSNPFGENVVHENQSEEDEMDLSNLTLEGLEKDNPELVEKMVTAYASKWALITPDKLEKIIARVRDDYAAVTVDDADIKESISTATEKSVFESVLKIARAVAESVKEKTTAEVTESVTAKVTAEMTEKNKTETEKAVAEAMKPVQDEMKGLREEVEKLTAPAKRGARAERIKAVCESTENIAFSVILRTQLEAVAESVELTDEFVNQKVAESQAIYNALGQPEGAGKSKVAGRPGQADGEEEKKESKSVEANPDEDFPGAPNLDGTVSDTIESLLGN